MITLNTPVTNKEEYLAWRKQWKADYAALSATIRDIKFARWFADSNRSGKVRFSEAQVARYKAIAEAHKGKWGFFPNHKLAELRAKATAMLAERQQSKILAQELYLKQRQPCSSPA